MATHYKIVMDIYDLNEKVIVWNYYIISPQVRKEELQLTFLEFSSSQPKRRENRPKHFMNLSYCHCSISPWANV